MLTKMANAKVMTSGMRIFNVTDKPVPEKFKVLLDLLESFDGFKREDTAEVRQLTLKTLKDFRDKYSTDNDSQ